MARFVKVGKNGTMINVEQIAYIEPAENKNEYIIHMIDGSAYCVTCDEFLKITGNQHQSDDNKEYAVRVLKGNSAERCSSYLNVNYRTNIVTFASDVEFEDWTASFTKNEIEELKKRDDIAIDWNKVELEETDDAE